MVNTAASLPARPGLQYGRSDSVFKVSCMSCSHNTRAAIKCEGRKKKPKKTPTSAGPKIRLAPPPSPVRHAWGFNGPPGASGADGRVTFTDTGDKKRETERESDAAAAKNDK